MSNDAFSTVFSCPRCSAAIAMQGERGICSYCGTPIERPGSLPTNPFSSTVNVSPNVYPRARVARRGWHPLLLFLLALLMVGGGFLAGRASVRAPLGPIVVLPTRGPGPGTIAATAIASIGVSDNGSLSELVATLPRDGAGADILAYMYHPDSSRYSLALIDGGSHAARWHSPLLSKDAYQGEFALGDDLVFLTDKTQLLALRRRDGTLAWQASLAVEPNSGCATCLRMLGKQVAVLEKDSTIEVFDGQSGQPAWHQRMPGGAYHLTAAGDRIIMFVEEAKQPTQLQFLDPATGKPSLQLQPECPSAHPGFDKERPNENTTTMLFNADSTRMYMMFGFFARCVQGWDLTNGKLLWQTALTDQQLTGSWDPNQPVFDDTTIYTSNYGQVWALNTSDGTVRELINDKEYSLKPIVQRDGTLIVLAAPTWDSQRQELWGLDVQSGARRWQQKLQAHQLRSGGSSGDWEERLTPQGLLVAQVLRDESQLIVATLDVSTGESISRQQHDLTDLHMPSLRASLWADDIGWLMLDNQVVAIDLKTGAISYRLK